MTPSMKKSQEISELINQGSAEMSGPQLLSHLVRLCTEQVLQRLLEHEQEQCLGRERYERVSCTQGLRNGYQDAKLCTAEGVLRLRLPQVRNAEKTYRSALWSRLSSKSQVLHQMVAEMYARGLSVRDIEETLTEVTGTFMASDTAISQATAYLYQQYLAFRQRDLRDIDLAYMFVDAVYEPLRRHGAKCAVLCAWGICTDGRRVLLGLETGESESAEAYLMLLRDLVARGLRTPMSVTTDGAAGLTSAVDKIFPRSLRIRCWFHKMKNLQSKVAKEVWPLTRPLILPRRFG